MSVALGVGARADAGSTSGGDQRVAAEVSEAMIEQFAAVGYRADHEMADAFHRTPMNNPDAPLPCLELIDTVFGVGPNPLPASSAFERIGPLIAEPLDVVDAVVWLVPGGTEGELVDLLNEMAGAEKCLEAGGPPIIDAGLDQETARSADIVPDLGIGDQSVRIDVNIRQAAPTPLVGWVNLLIVRVDRGAVAIARSGFGFGSTPPALSVVAQLDAAADALTAALSTRPPR